MRPSSTAAPLISEPQALPPVLHQALTNLDMQIEEELARYRRQRYQRTGTPRSTTPPAVAKPKTLNLIAIPARGGRTQPGSSPDSARVETGTDSPMAALSAASDGPAAQAPDADPVLDLVWTHATDAHEEQPGGSLSVAAAGLTAAPHGHLEDYLESSEALLQSLAVEEAQVRAETGFMKSLVTPVGIGSMLLLLLSSSLFGYVLMNPGSLVQILAMDPGGSAPSTAPNPQSAPAAASALSPLEPNLAAQEFKDLNLNTLGTLRLNGSALKSPNLPGPLPTAKPTVGPTGVAGKGALGAAGKPGTVPLLGLSSGKPSAGPSVVIQPRLGPVYRPSLPSIPVYQPPQSSGRSPAPRTSAPVRSSGRSVGAIAPTTATTRPSVLPSSSPTASPTASPTTSPSASPTATSAPSRRTVVVPFTNDRDLDAAQRVDPNAHMDSSFNDGITRINAGTYADEAAAKARVEQFQKQGVNAQIREEQ